MTPLPLSSIIYFLPTIHTYQCLLLLTTGRELFYILSLSSRTGSFHLSESAVTAHWTARLLSLPVFSLTLDLASVVSPCTSRLLSFFRFFIKVQFTKHKIIILKCTNSVTFSKLTALGNHHFYCSRAFHHPERKPCTH